MATARVLERFVQQVRPDTRQVVAPDIAQLDALVVGQVLGACLMGNK